MSKERCSSNIVAFDWYNRKNMYLDAFPRSKEFSRGLSARARTLYSKVNISITS